MPSRLLAAHLPLQWRLPILAGILVCATAGIIALASYQQVKRSTQGAIAARLDAVADQMSRVLEQQVPQLTQRTVTAAGASSVVAAATERGRQFTPADLVSADTTPIARALWSTDERLILADTMYPEFSGTAPSQILRSTTWNRDSARIGSFAASDSVVAYPVVAPVRSNGRTVAHLVEWRRVSQNPIGRDQLSGLLGSDGVLFLGSPGGAWTDQVSPVDGPPLPASALDTMVAYDRAGQGAKLARAAAVDGTPWMVLVEFPRTAVGLPVAAFMRRILLITIAATLAGLIAAWTMGRHIAKPIHELTDAVQTVNTFSPPMHVAVTGDHEVAHLATAFNQMADRVVAEADARRLSEEQWRLLFKSNPHPMWVFDTESLKFLAVNTAATLQYGYTHDEFLAMTIADIRPADELPRMQAAVAELSDGIRAPTMWKHRRKDGTIIDVEVHSHGLVFDRRPARLVLAHDVTARLALETQLRQAQKMEAVGQLAGGVAHDFNNLLTVIMAYGEMIAEQASPGDQLSDDIQQVLEASRKAHGLTRQLLAFSRRQVLQPEVLNVNDVIAATERMLRPLLGETTTIVLRLAPNTANVLADLGQLEQVLVNLAVNARDAMPVGGTLTISTGTVEIDEASREMYGLPSTGRFVTISVSDTGTGMSAETRSRVFEPFFTTKQHGRGTGLGLATVYGIVRQSGGHVTVYSEEGVGSTFRVYLPSTDALVPAAEPSVRSALPHGSETVLLVEDDAAVRNAVSAMLSRLGYTVLTASGGEEALMLARNSRPVDLVISDVIMPGMDGPAIVARLREEFPSVRGLLVSGYAGDTVARHHVDAMEFAFLEKPFSLPGLAAKIRAVLDA